MADQAELDAAHAELVKAIQKFENLARPGDYVVSWVLITEHTSIEMVRDNNSMVGILTPEEQSFVTTRGLLDVALSIKRGNGNFAG